MIIKVVIIVMMIGTEILLNLMIHCQDTALAEKIATKTAGHVIGTYIR